MEIPLKFKYRRPGRGHQQHKGGHNSQGHSKDLAELDRQIVRLFTLPPVSPIYPSVVDGAPPHDHPQEFGWPCPSTCTFRMWASAKYGPGFRRDGYSCEPRWNPRVA